MIVIDDDMDNDYSDNAMIGQAESGMLTSSQIVDLKLMP